MASPLRPRVVRLLLLVLPSIVTLAALSVTVAVAMTVQERTIRDATAERVMGVAESLAGLDDVRATLSATTDAGTPTDLADAADLASATAALQPLAELVGESAGVYYVVITDDEGVRITHPSASERGVQVETTDAPVLAGETFLGTERGASGPSLRAKVPVRDGERIVGMVAVGVLESSIAADRDAALAALLPWGIGALVIATLASSALTAAVERRFRRADVVAAENAQMRRTTAALGEQAHEFGTRLHVIHGLVSRGDAAEALGYIEDVVPVATADVDSGDGRPLASATMHAVRAELLEWGAQAEFDMALEGDLDDAAVTVVTNLCRNAGEAGATRVRCVLRDTAGVLAGAVDDDGPGVDPRMAGRIFGQGVTTKPDGSGFGRGYGLETVRRTVTSRGGTIEVGPSPLGGARFAFEMERV